MALHLVRQLFRNKKTSDTKFYTSFVTSYKEKTIYQSTLFKLVVVEYTSLLEAIKKP